VKDTEQYEFISFTEAAKRGAMNVIQVHTRSQHLSRRAARTSFQKR
jgi:hypothetical protein